MLPVSVVHILMPLSFLFFFFFNDTATTEIYTLSLHDALPISATHSDAWTLTEVPPSMLVIGGGATGAQVASIFNAFGDRKSTRLNSSHSQISYAVFCLKKKKKKKKKKHNTTKRKQPSNTKHSK